MCIGHGIHVAARAFVTFVNVRLKCLLLLLLFFLKYKIFMHIIIIIIVIIIMHSELSKRVVPRKDVPFRTQSFRKTKIF